MKWYQDKETIRMWARNLILSFFLGIFAYIIIGYTGTGKENIKPMTVFAYFAGLITSKLIDWYFIDPVIKEKDDKIKKSNHTQPV